MHHTELPESKCPTHCQSATDSHTLVNSVMPIISIIHTDTKGYQGMVKAAAMGRVMRTVMDGVRGKMVYLGKKSVHNKKSS